MKVVAFYMKISNDDEDICAFDCKDKFSNVMT